jgi:lysophospholipase L1-like esterase
MANNRRAFIKNLGIGSMASFALPATTFENDSVNEKSGLTILFQGDSITDGNPTRNNDWNHVMGHGFQFIISSKPWNENPESNLKFFNRGVSGNWVSGLGNRWQEDALNLKPDVISILIGVNDSMSVLNNQNPKNIEIFEEYYKNP